MKLLVIDDDTELTGFLKMSLEADRHKVDVSADGEQGIALLRSKEYDLVILDYILPQMDGKEVCRQIRESSDVPIIMLSVKTEVADKVELFELGADDFVCKPFSYRELTARINAVTRRNKHNETPCLVVDDLVVDREAHRVHRNTREVQLTRKEFDLLVFLIENRKRTVNRSDILRQVWNNAAEQITNTVETHIRNLRRKIELPGEKRLITTLKGVGYRIG